MKIKIIPILLLFILLAGCGSGVDKEPESPSEIIYVTKDNLETEVLNSEKTVLLDFYADWCGPCKMLEPILKEIAAERSDISVCKIDVDTETELSYRFEIEYMPTLIVMKNGEITERSVGLISKEEILEML